jgi:hypothetical protein
MVFLITCEMHMFFDKKISRFVPTIKKTSNFHMFERHIIIID